MVLLHYYSYSLSALPVLKYTVNAIVETVLRLSIFILTTILFGNGRLIVGTMLRISDCSLQLRQVRKIPTH